MRLTRLLTMQILLHSTKAKAVYSLSSTALDRFHEHMSQM